MNAELLSFIGMVAALALGMVFRRKIKHAVVKSRTRMDCTSAICRERLAPRSHKT